MGLTWRIRGISRHWAEGCYWCVCLIGLLVLGGWLAGIWEQGARTIGLVPMAPVVASLLVMLGGALAIRRRWPTRGVLWVLRGILLVVETAGVCVLLQAVFDIEMPLVHLAPPPDVTLRGIPVGRTSPVTAVFLCVLGGAVFLETAASRGRAWSRTAFVLSLAGLGGGLAVVLSHLAGEPMLYELNHIPVSLPTALSVVLLNLGLLLDAEVTWAFAARFLLPGRSGEATQQRRLSVDIAVIIAAVLGAAGFLSAFLFSSQATRVRGTATNELRAVVDLKAARIAGWLKERAADARVILGNPIAEQEADRFLSSSGDGARGQSLQSWVASLEREYGYSVALYDAQGTVRLGGSPPMANSSGESAFARALQSGDVVFQDLHLCSSGEDLADDVAVRLGFWVPVRAAGEGSEGVRGVWELQTDPEKTLFPMLAGWPIPSRTAETILVRREGGSVRYLQDLRYRTGTALRLMAQVEASSCREVVLAVQGASDGYESVDYRGVPVLAVARPIPDTSWVLIAKIDLDEVYAPLRVGAVYAAAAAAVLILLLASGLGLLGRRRENRWLLQELEVERSYRLLAERFALLSKHANDIILLFDGTGCVSEANDRALDVYGYSIDELQALGIHDIFVSDEEFDLVWDMRRPPCEEGVVIEKPHCRKDGSTFVAESSIHSVEIGGQSWTQVIVRDVTERKRAEKALRESMQRLHLATESGGLGVWDWDLEKGELTWNARMFEIYGFTMGDAEPSFDLWLNALHPDERAGALADLQAALNSGKRYDTEFRIVRPDGGERIVKADGLVILDEDGHAARMIGLNRDVSEARVSRALLQREREFSRAVLESIGDGVMACDSEGRLVLFNNTARLWFGRDVTALPKDEWSQEHGLYEMDGATLLATDAVPLVRALRGEIISGVELVVIARGLPPRYVQVSGGPLSDEDGHSLGAVIAMHDVSARHQMELALVERERDWVSICDNVPLLTFLLDADRRIRQINAAAVKYSRMDRRDAIGLRCGEALWCLHALAQPTGCDQESVCEECTLRRMVSDIVAGGVGLRQAEMTLPIVGVDGSEERRFFFVSATRLTVRREPMALVSMMDITERVQAERERIQLQTGIEQTAEAIVVADVAGTIRYVNPAIETLTGYVRSELLGEDWHILLRNMQDVAIRRDVAIHLGRGEVWRGQATNVRKDGASYRAEITVSPVRDATGNVAHCVMILRDVTRESELEARLLQAQKLEAIGTLAGGIAHDFNNILQALLGYADLAVEEVEKGSAAALYIQEIQTAGQRATDLVAHILAFSRRTERRLQHVDVQAIVSEALKLLRGTLPSTIEIVHRVVGECGAVLADPMQVHQVIMNLCTNAYHAMRDTGGVLEVLLEGVSLGDAESQEYEEIEPGSFLRLTVRDTGCGMEPSVLERIFDPYFTTKGEGEGTGLGLATVHGIVRSHHGAISVSSRVRHGTEFVVLLPVVGEASEVSSTRKAEGRSATTGAERVLFVDDEAGIAHSGRRALESLGYQVTVGRDGVEALEIFLAHPEEFDVVVTDQTMPRLTGVELAHAVLHVRPELPVILCTGYSDQVDEQGARALGIRQFIMKPVTCEILAQGIREALNWSKAGAHSKDTVLAVTTTPPERLA